MYQCNSIDEVLLSVLTISCVVLYNYNNRITYVVYATLFTLPSVLVKWESTDRFGSRYFGSNKFQDQEEAMNYLQFSQTNK